MGYILDIVSDFYNVFPLAITIGAFVYTYLKYQKPAKTATIKNSCIKAKNPKPVIRSVPSDFQWNVDPPLKPFPFKNGPYKLNMGIRNIDAQDWLLIEPTYLDRIASKSKLITNSHPDYPPDKDIAGNTVLLTEEASPAVRELYDVVINYMCDKYPMYFKRQGNGEVFNSITGKYLPERADKATDAREYLVELVHNIEEDFIILLKDPTREDEKDGTEYFFKAGVFAFAAGFNPKDRFNKPLSFVHHPVPGYESKLKLSMNRFFSRLSPGQFVNRGNFSVQTHNKLYVDDNNKGYHLPEGETQESLDPATLDFENQVHYRSERQVLTKLPESQAIVFSIRTYLLPMSELKKDEEVRTRFIGAIKGLPEDTAQYKRAGEWGPAVIHYLLN